MSERKAQRKIEIEGTNPTQPFSMGEALAEAERGVAEAAFKEVRKMLKMRHIDPTQLFQILDRNADGGVSYEELNGGLNILNVHFDEHHLEALWNRIDADGDGVLTREELRLGLFPGSNVSGSHVKRLYGAYKGYAPRVRTPLVNLGPKLPAEGTGLTSLGASAGAAARAARRRARKQGKGGRALQDQEVSGRYDDHNPKFGPRSNCGVHFDGGGKIWYAQVKQKNGRRNSTFRLPALDMYRSPSPSSSPSAANGRALADKAREAKIY